MADKGELESLEAATRSYLGWKKVQATSESLNLSAQQRRQTDDWVSRLNQTVSDRMRDSFVWSIYPEQFDPTKPFELIAERVPDSGGRSLPERVSAKLERGEQLITELGAPILGATLHEQLGSLWEEREEITIGELWGYFTRYIYLPRLVCREVLDRAVTQALTAVLVNGERFAIATGKDTETGRYRGLIVPPNPGEHIQITDSTLLVNIHRAQQQLETDQQEVARINAATTGAGSGTGSSRATGSSTAPSTQRTSDHPRPATQDPTPKPIDSRYFGSVRIDPDRYARSIGDITREVIDQLAGTGAKLEITIDIQATKPEGFTQTEVRTISENTNVLKFEPSSGFEEG